MAGTTLKVEFKTEDLKKLCDKVSKGVKNDKLIYMTGLLKVELKNNVFSLTATDLTNFLTVTQDKVLGEDFTVLAVADPFLKLISKISSPEITLSLVETVETTRFEVRAGKNKYNLEIYTGEPFPEFAFEEKGSKEIVIKKLIFDRVIENNKYSLAKTDEVQIFKGMYFGDSSIATDGEKMALTQIDIFNENVLLRPEVINLVSVFDDEEINVKLSGSSLIFSDTKSTLCTMQMPKKETFPKDKIQTMFDKTEFPSKVVIKKAALLSALDRLTIFEPDAKKNKVSLSFNEEGLVISNVNNAGVEVLEYEEGTENFKTFAGTIKVEFFKTQLTSVGENVNLWYGNPNMIKFTHENLILLTGLEQ